MDLGIKGKTALVVAASKGMAITPPKKRGTTTR